MRLRWSISITVALALLLTALGVGAGGAAAQDSSTLVSNTGQTTGTNKWSDRDHSQAFTTGGESSGYNITSVAFEFAIQSPGNTVQPTFEVRIQLADAQGRPTGGSLGTFVRSDPLAAGVNTFTVEGSPVHLDPNTQYVLVFDFTTRGNRDVQIAWTNSDDKDADGAPSWSASNNGLSRGFSSPGAFSMIGSETDSLKFSIGGFAGAAIPSVYELLGDYFSGAGSLSDLEATLRAYGQTYHQSLESVVAEGRLSGLFKIGQAGEARTAWGTDGTENWVQVGLGGYPRVICYYLNGQSGETRCADQTEVWGSRYQCGGQNMPGFHRTDYSRFNWACTQHPSQPGGQWVPVKVPRPGVDYTDHRELNNQVIVAHRWTKAGGNPNSCTYSAFDPLMIHYDENGQPQEGTWLHRSFRNPYTGVCNPP